MRPCPATQKIAIYFSFNRLICYGFTPNSNRVKVLDLSELQYILSLLRFHLCVDAIANHAVSTSKLESTVARCLKKMVVGSQ